MDADGDAMAVTRRDRTRCPQCGERVMPFGAALPPVVIALIVGLLLFYFFA
jgi:hypothetical protein